MGKLGEERMKTMMFADDLMVWEQLQDWNEEVKECGMKFSMAECEMMAVTRNGVCRHNKTKQNRRGVHPVRANRIEARKRNMHPQGGSEQDKQGATDIESEQNGKNSKNRSPMDTKNLQATPTIVISSEENQDMNGGDDEPLSKFAKHETKNIEDNADNMQAQSNGEHHEVDTNEQDNSNVGDLNNTEKFVATIVKDSVRKQEEPDVADKTTTKSFAPLHVEDSLGSDMCPIVSVNRLKEGVTTQQNGNESLGETSERNESVTAEEVDLSDSEYSLKLNSSTEDSSFKSSQEPQKYIDISLNSNKADEEHLAKSSNDAEKSPSKSEKDNTVLSKVHLDVPSRYLYSDRSQTPSPRRSTRLTTLKYEAMVNLNEISVESIDDGDDLATGHSQSFIHSSTDQNRIATKLNVSEGNIPTEAGSVSHKLPFSTIKGRKSYRSPTSNTFPITASTSTYISKYIRDTHSVAVAGPSGLCRKTPSESGRKTPSESDRKTPSESGRKTPSESGCKTLYKGDRKTPSEGGRKTPSEYGHNTPSESGRTTPAESGRNTPSESGRVTPLETKKTGPAALTTAIKIISSENYLVHEPDTDLANTTDESDVEMNESLALLSSRSAKRKEPSLIKQETKRAKLSPGPSFAHFNINFSPPFSYLGGRVTKQATALDESEFDSTAEEASNYHCSNAMVDSSLTPKKKWCNIIRSDVSLPPGTKQWRGGRGWSKLVLKQWSIPSLTTAKLERASGTLTPAATKVSPITVSGIPRVLPGIDRSARALPHLGWTPLLYNTLFGLVEVGVLEHHWAVAAGIQILELTLLLEEGAYRAQEESGPSAPTEG
uniref:Uncharacterized protein n=1 Tax=Timema douglasi TaxID=61478 RepID=A0A7R8VHE1_TIMDO|nr:unnamed protein product [Timema douglasi]